LFTEYTQLQSANGVTQPRVEVTVGLSSTAAANIARAQSMGGKLKFTSNQRWYHIGAQIDVVEKSSCLQFL